MATRLVDGSAARLLKGRGASLNPESRFGEWRREGRFEADAAEWTSPDGSETAPAPVKTQVTREIARSILSRNASPDVPFTTSLNPYRGCEHGCVYCYARPSHAYLDLSPGLDFETRLHAKVNAAELLRQALGKPGYRCETLALGANTDPYQPIEREFRITRGVLEVLSAHGHPVGIVTKNALVLRDLDLLADMARRNLVQVFLSITTLDHDLARRMEPRASSPTRRLETLAALKAAGVPCGVMVAPVIPFLNDQGIEQVLAAAADAGASRAGYVLLRLPYEIKELFKAWLTNHYPLKAEHVMSRIRAMRQGRENDPRFGARMRGQGVMADLLAQRFDKACRRLGLNQGRGELDTRKFRVPEAPAPQLSLF